MIETNQFYDYIIGIQEETAMKSMERQKKMLEYLADHDELSVEDAVRLFNASPATVRRDFTDLDANGSVTRMRGGIRCSPGRQDNVLPFTLREKWFSEEKRRLAYKAFELVRNAKVLFIEGGTTTSHLGMFLSSPMQTLITNSIPLCNLLAGRFQSGGGPEVLLTGGRFQLRTGLLLGPNAESGAAQYHADAVILSVRGINSEAIYNNNELIAGIGRVMIANSARVIVIADHSKIGTQAMCRVSSLSPIDCLITMETPENRSALESIRAAGVHIERINSSF